MPNNRQIALLMLLVIMLAWCCANSKIRKSLYDILQSMMHGPIAIVIGIFAVWILLAHLALVYAGIWDISQTSDSIFWVFGAGFPLLLNFSDAKKPGFFFRQAAELFGITAILEFFVNATSFTLMAEILIQPIVIFLSVTAVVAARTAPAVGCILNVGLALFGFYFLAYSCVNIYIEWTPTRGTALLNGFLSPVLLSIALLPMLYLLGLYGAYEVLFLRMRNITSCSPRWQAYLGTLLCLHFRLRRINEFSGSWIRRIAESETMSDAIGIAFEFLSNQRDRDLSVRDKRIQLRLFAGATGVDESGAKLDRREFDATWAALRHLAMCHVGWHKQLGHYREDLLDVIGDFRRFGLDLSHQIEMRVAPDNKSWYAYRKTLSGHVLGIGANLVPLHHWYYDYDSPPATFPSEGMLGWHSTFDEVPPNWRDNTDATSYPSTFASTCYQWFLLRIVNATDAFVKRMSSVT